MGRQTNKLTAVAVNKLSAAGMYSDGGGLYLRISPSGTKSWIFRFGFNGKYSDLGLGALGVISLAAARKKAEEYRLLLANGQNPLFAKKAADLRAKYDHAKMMTFRECVESYVEINKDAWKGKNVTSWARPLEIYAYPIIGDLNVADIDTPLIMKILEPIWKKKTETAKKVRLRIELVIDWARVRGLRDGENPVRWRGHLSHLLPSPEKIHKTKHHPALEYTKIADFMQIVRASTSVGARALEFTILTACRTTEVRAAKWKEVDFKNMVWIIPAERMKADKEHRVPLSTSAGALLESLFEQRIGDYIFPGIKKDTCISNMTMMRVIDRYNEQLDEKNRLNITVHGFRSTFRDWAEEISKHQREIAEAALAHAVGNKVEQAYRRGDALEKRRAMMEDWAKYCERCVVVDFKPQLVDVSG